MGLFERSGPGGRLGQEGRLAERRAARPAIVLVALALWLLSASPANAVRSEFFGIAHGPVLDAQDLQGMRAARIRTDRALLLWRRVQPSQGSFNWSHYDLVVGGLASHGIRPFPFVYGTPDWVGAGSLAQPPIDSAAAEQAWGNFLRAAVARYGPGGSYWANEFPQDHPGATPLPVQAWQIWNEPNQTQFFSPESTGQQAAQRYARLLQISHDAIKSQHQQAQIVLAGMFSEARVTTWAFLNHLYGVAGIKDDFDAAALHPYRCNLDQTRIEIGTFRSAMTSHADGATPLWITEFAWGSAPPDNVFCRNKGLAGQRQLLDSSYELFLERRSQWNLQRVFWFVWRDPAPGSEYAGICRICGSAGLVHYGRTPKLAHGAFTGFTAETTPPAASITGGPGQGSFTKDPTPTFSFASNEPGSTFVCRIDSSPFTACSSPYTRAMPLPNGAHTFSVKAIDAPGNESAVVSRSFTVDTVPPQTSITSGPSGPTTDDTPTFTFSASEPGSTFACRFDSQAFAPCSGPGARHTPSTPLSVGSHSFDVRATDRAQNTDPTPARRTFTVIIP